MCKYDYQTFVVWSHKVDFISVIWVDPFFNSSHTKPVTKKLTRPCFGRRSKKQGNIIGKPYTP